MRVHDLQEMIKQCGDDSHRWFPRTASNLLFLSHATMTEAGEAGDWVKKIWRGSHELSQEATKEGRTMTVKEWIEEELVDSLIYMCNQFHLLGTDPIAIYNKKRQINEERFAEWDSCQNS